MKNSVVDVSAKIQVNFFNQDMMIISDVGSVGSEHKPVEYDADNVYDFCDGFCPGAGLSRRKLYCFDRAGILNKIECSEVGNKAVVISVSDQEKQYIERFAAAHPHLFLREKSEH